MNDPGPRPTNERILKAAAELLAEGGLEAVSTRAVSARAGVQAPTLYRLFGDKQGMLDALASYGFARFLVEKSAHHPIPDDVTSDGGDPLDVLRRGWDLHVDFGLAEPALYVLMYGAASYLGQRPPAAKEAYERLSVAIQKVAASGVLRVPVDVAAKMIHSAVIGVTLNLITAPDGPQVSHLVREAVLAAITASVGDRPGGRSADALATRALALDAILADQADIFSEAETALLRQWLRRLADG